MEDAKKVREPKSSFYPAVIEYLKKLSQTEYSSLSHLARELKVNKAAFSKNLNYATIANADDFCSWLEKLGGELFLPGELPPQISKDNDINRLNEQLDTYRKLVETQEQLIRILQEQVANAISEKNIKN